MNSTDIKRNCDITRFSSLYSTSLSWFHYIIQLFVLLIFMWFTLCNDSSIQKSHTFYDTDAPAMTWDVLKSPLHETSFKRCWNSIQHFKILISQVARLLRLKETVIGGSMATIAVHYCFMKDQHLNNNPKYLRLWCIVHLIEN